MKKSAIILFIFFVFMHECSAQLIPYRVRDKWGYSDTSGNLIIMPQYELADFFDEGVAFIKKDSVYFLIDPKGDILAGKFIMHGKFANGLCPVMDRSLNAYFINNTGKNAFNTTFSGAENFSEGLAVVSMKHKLGIINTKGDWVREPSFDSSSICFRSGFLLAKNKGRFFYIDKHGKELVLPDSLRPAGIFSEGLAAVYAERKLMVNNTSMLKSSLKFIDSSGNIVLSRFINDSLDYGDYMNYEKEFIDGQAIISVPNELASDRYFINKKGKFSHVFSYAQQLGDSMFLGVAGYYLPSIRIYDKDFFVMGDFSKAITSAGVFGDGLLAVQDRTGYWGYCDSSTRMVIPYIYQSANPFTNGFAIVVARGKFGVINLWGKEFFRED